MIQYIRSVFFIVQMYVAMFLMACYWAPLTLLRRDAAFEAVGAYCRYVRWSAQWMVGLRTEVRGPIPDTEVLIASKHQSFLDIIMIVSVVPRPKFIMKASLVYAPILGWFALKIGCVPVNRGKRAEAIRQMMAGVTAGDAPRGQLIIYPQGTRVAPGVTVPYKVGSAVIYEETGQVCVPAATNVGVFWPRQGILRKPGLAVVEFLEPIQPGLTRDAFLKDLETRVEARSDVLMAEAGFIAKH